MNLKDLVIAALVREQENAIRNGAKNQALAIAKIIWQITVNPKNVDLTGSVPEEN